MRDSAVQESDVDEEPESQPHVETTSSVTRTLTVESQGHVTRAPVLIADTLQLQLFLF